MRRSFATLAYTAVAVLLAMGFSGNARAGTVDPAATTYLQGLAAAALRNAQPTNTRVAFWTRSFKEQFDFDYLIAHALGKNSGAIREVDREAVRNWAVGYFLAPEGRFMELIKNSILTQAEVGGCEISGATCLSRVRFKRFGDSDLQLVVFVIKRGEGYKVSEIVYNETFPIREPLVKAMREAYRIGQLQLAAN